MAATSVTAVQKYYMLALNADGRITASDATLTELFGPLPVLNAFAASCGKRSYPTTAAKLDDAAAATTATSQTVAASNLPPTDDESFFTDEGWGGASVSSPADARFAECPHISALFSPLYVASFRGSPSTWRCFRHSYLVEGKHADGTIFPCFITVMELENDFVMSIEPEGAPFAIVTVKRDLTICNTNLKAVQIFGHGTEEMIGKNVSSLIPGLDDPMYLEMGLDFVQHIVGRHSSGSLLPLCLVMKKKSDSVDFNLVIERMERSIEVVFFVDVQSELVINCSKSFVHCLFGRFEHEIVGKRLWETVLSEQTPLLREWFRYAIAHVHEPTVPHSPSHPPQQLSDEAQHLIRKRRKIDNAAEFEQKHESENLESWHARISSLAELVIVKHPIQSTNQTFRMTVCAMSQVSSTSVVKPLLAVTLTREDPERSQSQNAWLIDMGSYVVTNHIGSGDWARVYRAVERNCSTEVAVKVMRRSVLENLGILEWEKQRTEKAMTLKHPYINEILSYILTSTDFVIVMGYCESETTLAEELRRMRLDWKLLASNTALVSTTASASAATATTSNPTDFLAPTNNEAPNMGGFGESEARNLFRQLCSGLQYLHKQGLSMEGNCTTRKVMRKNGSLKWIDVGVSRNLIAGVGVHASYNAKLGIGYCAAGFIPPPESFLSSRSLQEDYYRKIPYNFEAGRSCDMWCMGIILYQLISNALPFRSVMENMMSRFLYPQDLNGSLISVECQNLLRGLLTESLSTRLSIDNVVQGEWLNAHIP